MAFVVKVATGKGNMSDATLETVQQEIERNQAIGQAMLALGAATMENGESFRSVGYDAVADACDALCRALSEAVVNQANTFVALLKRQGAMEAQIADLDAMLADDDA